MPCLLGRYSDIETDAFAGLHRIALQDDVFVGAKVQRMTLGSWPKPRAIKLFAKANGKLFLGEGIETALAAAHFKRNGERMQPVWAAGCKDNIADFPIIGTDLVLLVDHDEAGERAANTCRARYRAVNRDVERVQTREPGTDFNDLLLERRGRHVG